MPQKKRLFFACFPGPEGRKIIADYHKKLTPWNNELRMPREENWHITLHFLGETDDEISESLKQSQLQLHPFTLKGFRPEVYTRRGNPSALVLAVDADKGLSFTHQMIEKVCHYHNLPTKKKFQPHITLAYMKRNAPQKAVRSICDFWINELSARKCEDSRKSIELMQSILSPEGSHYYCEKRWLLDISPPMTQH